jgi:hypothetical protein
MQKLCQKIHQWDKYNRVERITLSFLCASAMDCFHQLTTNGHINNSTLIVFTILVIIDYKINLSK